MLWNNAGKLACLGLITILSACQSSDNQPRSEEDKVARIGERIIYSDELDFQLQKFSSLSDDRVRRKVLESLAMTRLFAQLQQEQMSKEELRQLEIATLAYRDEILAKRYIKNNVPRNVPDHSDVTNYYQKHKKRFGEKQRFKGDRLYLKQGCGISTELTQQDVLTGTSLEKVRSSGCVKSQDKFTSSDSQFNKLAEMPAGIWQQTNQGFSLVVINEAEVIPARPLAEVAGDIRKSLAPEYLKQALIQHRDQYAKEIEYFD